VPRRVRPLRIGIATAGRFHVLDLARELHALGHHVRFYSYVPKRRAIQFGLPAECHVDLLPALAPYLAWGAAAPKTFADLRERLTWRALNRAVIERLEACDVFTCMSGIYLEAPLYAQETFGAKIILQRGSTHILSQDEVLAGVPGAERPSRLAIARELAGYSVADRIAIPSQHVEKTFERDPALLAKTVRNPYGLDLTAFPQLRSRDRSETLTIVFAGTWCLRKGCDLLVEAVRRHPPVRLLHAGPLGDIPFPKGDPQIVHIPKVDQSALSSVFDRAHAFVLASREEGLSLVLAQALASGLPVLCTSATGGADLRHTPALTDRVLIVRSGDLNALIGGLQALRDRFSKGPEFALLRDDDRETLSWSAYARRFQSDLLSLFQNDDPALPPDAEERPSCPKASTDP
jgi:alpha-maltose-1-phosphate synthase